MRIGCPKEIKVHEYRVGLVPAGVRELVADGHEVYMQTMAGAGIGRTITGGGNINSKKEINIENLQIPGLLMDPLELANGLLNLEVTMAAYGYQAAGAGATGVPGADIGPKRTGGAGGSW